MSAPQPFRLERALELLVAANRAHEEAVAEQMAYEDHVTLDEDVVEGALREEQAAYIELIDFLNDAGRAAYRAAMRIEHRRSRGMS